MCDCLEKRFLEEQLHHIKKVANHITNLRRVGPDLGKFMFDQKMLDCRHLRDGTQQGGGLRGAGLRGGGLRGAGLRGAGLRGAGQQGATHQFATHQCANNNRCPTEQ